MEKIILHLCADTGSDTKPYRDAGYKVILVGKDIGVENYGYGRSYEPPKNVYGIIANPVCTEFSTARSTGKARNPEKGMEIVRECQRIISECNPVFWVIENPATGRLKDFLGIPVMTYEPWHFGSPWTKKTALWGTFNPPPDLTIIGRMCQKYPSFIFGPVEENHRSHFYTKAHVNLYQNFGSLISRRMIWNLDHFALKNLLVHFLK